MDTRAALPGLSNDKGALDQRLSFDVQGVDALRRTARQSPQEGLRQASKQFEVLFMGMLLKSMREATPSEGLFSSQTEKTYTSMLDQQLAQKMSGRGLGLAEAMYAQLSKTLGSEAAGVPQGAQGSQGLQGFQALQPSSPSLAAAPRPAFNESGNRPLMPTGRPADLSAYEKVYESATAQASLSRSQLPQTHVENFVTRLLPAAQRASEASGVPAQLIMAQAALESGWGRREIKGEGGQPTFNLFGIKADKSWKGPVAEVTTTEYVRGKAEQTQASFRAYASYDEAFADYARFLTSNPRYASVRSAPDAAEAAHGLQRAGYATDPAYGDKLVRIMKQL